MFAEDKNLKMPRGDNYCFAPDMGHRRRHGISCKDRAGDLGRANLLTHLNYLDKKPRLRFASSMKLIPVLRRGNQGHFRQTWELKQIRQSRQDCLYSLCRLPLSMQRSAWCREIEIMFGKIFVCLTPRMTLRVWCKKLEHEQEHDNSRVPGVITEAWAQVT